MEFKIGQKWNARGGMIVTIVELYQDGRDFPVIGVFSNSNDLQEFKQTGRFVSDDTDSPGDLIELVQEAHNYTSPNQYSMMDFLQFLERQYLINGAVTVPNEVKAKTATLVQAITYMLDQQNNGHAES